MWTLFWDMHSGGGSKEKWTKIYIEAPEAEARVIFYNRFGHSPDRVSCTCCGNDYSVDESKTLKEASAFHRDCDYNPKTNRYVERKRKGYRTLKQYLADPEVLVIRAKEIRPEERVGTVPVQGYVWRD